MSADERCQACDHPRTWHTERLRGCPALCCPLPCECLGFVPPEIYADRTRWCPHGFARITSGRGQGLSACPECSAAASAPVYTAPLGITDAQARDAIRAFGPGTTEGGRAEAGWRCAGRFVGDGPDIRPEPAVDGWDR